MSTESPTPEALIAELERLDMGTLYTTSTARCCEISRETDHALDYARSIGAMHPLPPPPEESREPETFAQLAVQVFNEPACPACRVSGRHRTSGGDCKPCRGTGRTQAAKGESWRWGEKLGGRASESAGDGTQRDECKDTTGTARVPKDDVSRAVLSPPQIREPSDVPLPQPRQAGAIPADHPNSQPHETGRSQGGEALDPGDWEPYQGSYQHWADAKIGHLETALAIEKAARGEAEQELAKRDELIELAGKRVAELEAQLEAVRELPAKWRKAMSHGITGGEKLALKWCASELEQALNLPGSKGAGTEVE